MIAVRSATNSFADAVIAARGARAGCKTTMTFDLEALRSPGFTLLESR